MIGSAIRSLRRSLSDILYVPKDWDRDNQLSVSGVFDYVFTNPTKREIVAKVALDSFGRKKSYTGDDFMTVLTIAYSCAYRPQYMNLYEDLSIENERVREEKSLHKYLKYKAFPELVGTKVLELVVETDNGNKMFLSDLESLVNKNVIEKYDRQYKEPPIISPNRDEPMDILGVRPSDRFWFAYNSLNRVYDVQPDKDMSNRLL